MKKIIYVMLIMVILLAGCGQISSEEAKTTLTEEAGTTLTEEELADVKEALELKHELRCGEEGKFKILVISDVQAATITPKAKERIQILVDRETPDLVLFGGDNSRGIKSAENLKQYLTDMVGYIESKQIPWAHVFGNHDSESNRLTKEDQEEIYESFEYCLSKKGTVTGVGNYVLPILCSDSDDIAFNVFSLDSGTYNLEAEKNTGSLYDYIRFDQVLWYREMSELLEKYNENKIPSMMFFHIPLPESEIAWEHRELLKYEGECRTEGDGTVMNPGLFAAALDRGDVKIIVNGHKHTNNAMIEYFGIKLCYSMTVTTAGYFDADMLGGRVVIIDQADAENVETYLSYVE